MRDRARFYLCDYVIEPQPSLPESVLDYLRRIASHNGDANASVGQFSQQALQHFNSDPTGKATLDHCLMRTYLRNSLST